MYLLLQTLYCLISNPRVMNVFLKYQISVKKRFSFILVNINYCKSIKLHYVIINKQFIKKLLLTSTARSYKLIERA